MRRAAEDVVEPASQAREHRRAFEWADPEPIIGLLEPLALPERRRRLQEVIAHRLDAVTVVLDALHDPHNGAAVLRSCDAFGVARIHVLERSEPFVAARGVAKGSQRWVEVVSYRRTEALLAALAAGQHRLVAAHPAGELVPADLASIDRVALLLGNEHAGIHDDLLSACAARVRVPMRGFVESLNVSVTAAILIGEATRRRPGDLPVLRQRQLYARALALSVPRAMDVLAASDLQAPRP